MFNAHQKKRLRRIAAIARSKRDAGLSEEKLEMLVDLSLHPDSSYPEIGARTGLNPDTMRRYAMQLRNQGFLIRRVIDGDVRRVRFSLSAKGAEVLLTLCGSAA